MARSLLLRLSAGIHIRLCFSISRTDRYALQQPLKVGYLALALVSSSPFRIHILRMQVQRFRRIGVCSTPAEPSFLVGIGFPESRSQNVTTRCTSKCLHQSSTHSQPSKTKVAWRIRDDVFDLSVPGLVYCCTQLSVHLRRDDTRGT